MFFILKQWICCSVDFEVHICVFSPRQLGTSAGNLHTSWCFNLQNSYWISLYYITFWRQHLFTCLCYSSSWNDCSKKAKVHCVVKQHYHLPNLPCLFWLALFFEFCKRPWIPSICSTHFLPSSIKFWPVC